MENKSNNALQFNINAKKTQQQAQAYLKAELSMGDEQVLGILKALSVPLKTTLHSVEDAYKEKNPIGISEAAHSLKGALLNLGLDELAEVAKTIEQSATSTKTAIKKQIEQDLDYLRGSLKHLFK